MSQEYLDDLNCCLDSGYDGEALKPQLRKKIYLSGPMRGYPNYNFPLFYSVSALLTLWGWQVFNPAQMDIDDGKAEYNRSLNEIVPDSSFTIEDALRRDFRVILQCDAVALLPGWENSEGACRELGMAMDIGLPVYTVETQLGTLTGADYPALRIAVAERYAKKVERRLVETVNGIH